MSQHEAKVVRLGEIKKHPNADSLGIVSIGGYTCVVRLDDWREGDLAVYVEPDYVVPTDRPIFSFLAKDGRTRERITVRKFRSVMSQGLLVRAPAGFAEGDNAAPDLGIERYEPPMAAAGSGGEAEKPPSVFAPCYDVEPLRKYPHAILNGTIVLVSEKIHGANGRFVFHDGRMWCGSRTEWKREDQGIMWWRALTQNPWLEKWCRANPNHIAYGEVFGQVQDLKYGAGKSDLFIRVFDVMCPHGWLHAVDLYDCMAPGHLAPLVWTGPYDFELVAALASGPSLVPGASHLREGIVIHPANETRNDEIGRLVLKVVSDDYIGRKG